MPTLRGKVSPWEAPSNKGDAARYWGHSGSYTLVVAEDTALEVRNAVGGVILRPSDTLSETTLAGYLGEDVEVDGTFSAGQEHPAEAPNAAADPHEQAPHTPKGPAPSGPRVSQEPVMQTLMVPSRLGDDGRVSYEPAPRVEGAGFVVHAIRRL